MNLTICIIFVENVTPIEVYVSISFRHDPIKTVAMSTIYVWIFTFLHFAATDHTL